MLFIGTPLNASEDVDADRQLWVPNILMLIAALAMSCFTQRVMVLFVTTLNGLTHTIKSLFSGPRKFAVRF
jgi:hypothetical protein